MEQACELKATIAEYSSQLVLLNESLECVEGEERQALLTLRDDINELITVTKDQLLCLCKSDLLNSTLGEQQPCSSSASGPSHADNDQKNELSDCVAVMELEDQDNDSQPVDLIGMRCLAPYGTELGHVVCGGLRAHAAVIYELTNQHPAIMEDWKVRVLFSHPMYLRMKPCPFFLEDRCSFDDKCRYSHGYLVRFGDLLEYEEPDFECVQQESMCLVNKDESEGLWSLARVQALDHAQQQLAVTFIDTNEQMAINWHQAYPVRMLGSGTAYMQSEQGDLEHETTMADARSEQTPDTKYTSKIVDKEFGNWEQHTKGFGSKLMAKMGYTIGEGLGKRSDGLLQPIEAKLMPKGKSLDACIAHREQYGAHDVYARMKQDKHKLLVAERKEKRKRTAVETGIFGFINKRLGDKTNSQKQKASGNGKGRAVEAVEVDKHTSDKQLNIELYELDKQQRAARNEVRKHTQTHERCVQLNQVASAKNTQLKLAQAQAQMAMLKQRHSKLNREKQRRHARKSSQF